MPVEKKTKFFATKAIETLWKCIPHPLFGECIDITEFKPPEEPDYKKYKYFPSKTMCENEYPLPIELLEQTFGFFIS